MPGWLLIFDNADKVADIAGWPPAWPLPAGVPSHVIITNGRSGFGALGRVMDLDVIGLADAVRQISDDTVELIAARLTAIGCCTTGTWYTWFMEASAAIDRISALLDQGGQETSNTSMRIPVALRDAAALAVRELGVAPSATALTTAALRATLEAVVMQAVLDNHYEHHRQARPDLGDLAVAAAEIDGHPLAREPERLRLAAAEIAVRHPAATPDDVLLWAEARAFAAA